MKHLKKIMALLIAMVMVLAMGVTVSAQTEASGMGGTGTITIKNAALGETYKVVKLFDATVSVPDPTKPEDFHIAYTGTIPTTLTNYFETDSVGNITLKRVKDSSGKNPGEEGYVETFYSMTDDDFANLKTWADGVPANDTTYPSVSAEMTSGSTLEFTGLKYGYYVITSTQGVLVTVDSTTPNVTIVDKNTKEPSAKKEVAPGHVSVGDTVTYTATFGTTNFMNNPTSGDPEQVVSYIISDTLPAFLDEVKVTEVKIVTTPGIPAVEDDPATEDVDESKPAVPEVATSLTVADYQFVDKKIEIPWVSEFPDQFPTNDHKYTSLYKNGAQIVITYTAEVTADANVGSPNINKVSIMPQVDRGSEKKPYDENDRWNDEATIYTHAAALQKKANSEDGDNLAGAEFSFKGLVVTGVPGFYTVVSYDKSNDAANGTIMKCDANGQLIIAGIDADSDTPIKLTGTETKAPDGFNKIEGTFDLQTIVMSTETTTTHGEKTTWYDADGNIVDQQVSGGSSITRNEITALNDVPATSIQKVVNKEGLELPATGGIGKRVFIISGSVLLLGAAILLITRRRMSVK